LKADLRRRIACPQMQPLALRDRIIDGSKAQEAV
jgi:hypothetical protein